MFVFITAAYIVPPYSAMLRHYDVSSLHIEPLNKFNCSEYPEIVELYIYSDIAPIYILYIII